MYIYNIYDIYILFIYLFIYIYILCMYLLRLDEVGCVDPGKCFEICESRTGCSNIAMPKLVLEIMPSG